MRGHVLVVAASQSGAGIQADIATVMALGGDASAALTALIARAANGQPATIAVPPDFVALQMRHALAEIRAGAVVTGWLADAPTIASVAAVLASHPGTPFVLDPALGQRGHTTLDPAAVAMLKRVLVPLATVVTPNVAEAETLSGMAIACVADMHHAAEALLTMGVPAVLLTGGQLDGPEIIDVLATADGTRLFTVPRLATRQTHGSGRALASAIATGLSQNMNLQDAVARAHRHVHAVIEGNDGAGHGPRDHSAGWEREVCS